MSSHTLWLLGYRPQRGLPGYEFPHTVVVSLQASSSLPECGLPDAVVARLQKSVTTFPEHFAPTLWSSGFIGLPGCESSHVRLQALPGLPECETPTYRGR